MNNVLPCLSEDGTHYFYENPLVSDDRSAGPGMAVLLSAHVPENNGLPRIFDLASMPSRIEANMVWSGINLHMGKPL